MAEIVTGAPMSTQSINDLPDSAFAYIEPGGSKDAEGKTTPRSLRHFPIHDKAHVQNALSRAPQSPFGEKAMPKIREAARKYGIKVAAADLLSIEVARPGSWRLASGDLTVTAEMLADAARYAQRPGARPSPVKLGHTDPRFSGDGEPALGWLANLRVEDDNGPVLVGDITDMPDWLAAAAPAHWPDRSMEGWTDFEADDGETYGLVVDGLALLGVTPPGMSSIRSLRDLPQALGVAASARIVARAPQTPAPTAEVPTDKKEAGQMDPAKIREALGLSADASDDEARVAFDAAFTSNSPPPEPVQASLFEPPAPKAETAPKKETVNAAGSWMRVEASAWEAAQDRIKKLEAQAQKQREGERDQIIAKAVQDGKFAPARREHWVRLWNADPEGTRDVIDGLARNVIPVMASGYAGDGEEDIDAEYAHLFPPTASKGV